MKNVPAALLLLLGLFAAACLAAPTPTPSASASGTATPTVTGPTGTATPTVTGPTGTATPTGTTTPTGTAMPSATPSRYSCYYATTIDGNAVDLRYNLNAMSMDVRLSVSIGTLGWIGMGVGSTTISGMEDSDIVAQIGSDLPETFEGNGGNGRPVATSNYVITNTATSFAGSTQTMEFTWDYNSGNYAIEPTGANALLLAFSPNDDADLTNHGNRRREFTSTFTWADFCVFPTGTPTGTAGPSGTATASPTASATPTATFPVPDAYECALSFDIDGTEVLLDYNLNAETLDVRMSAQVEGYLGIGFGPGSLTAGMGASNLVVSRNGAVESYRSNGFQAPTIFNNQALFASSASTANGGTDLVFTRFYTGGSQTIDITSDDNALLIAYQTDSAFEYHGDKARMLVTNFDWNSGCVAATGTATATATASESSSVSESSSSSESSDSDESSGADRIFTVSMALLLAAIIALGGQGW